MATVLHQHPKESPNWRKHKNACPNYRERWFRDSDPFAGEPLYQVFCLMGTPPLTQEEQDKCLHSRCRCWRLAEQKKEA